MKKSIINLLLALTLMLGACSNELQFDLGQGPAGENGKSVIIDNIITDESGNITVTFTNGTDSWNIIIPAGKDGKDGLSIYDYWVLTLEPGACNTEECFWEAMRGQDGTSVTIIDTYSDIEGTVITFSDGTEIFIANGVDGINGIDGINGKDGKSITIKSVCKDKNGNNVITFSDGTKITVLNGKNGKDGVDGKDGKDGKDACVVYKSCNVIDSYYCWVKDLPKPKTFKTKTCNWNKNKNKFEDFLDFCKNTSDYYLTSK